MIRGFARKRLSKLLTGEAEIALVNRVPSVAELGEKLREVDELGIYLHIPFCDQMCRYCPYNRELYRSEVAREYASAVRREIDFYADVVGKRPITSLYIGGGTPTTMLHSGIENILEHLFATFDMQCDLHMESHPNDLCPDNLRKISSLGVRHLSVGVEALQDRHLETLGRTYTTSEVRTAVDRAVSWGFECVNVDVMFALPHQTYQEIEETGHALMEMGVDQVAAYPLFSFPYTRMGGRQGENGSRIPRVFRRRKMLRVLESIFYGAGFERSSVWAFTRKGVPKYCSVTVPLYLGLGASGGTYLKDIFYLNTFNVAEYIDTLRKSGMAIALSLDLSKKMQMAGWLYWRVYETRFDKADFEERFGKDFDSVYGGYIKPLASIGFLEDDGGEIVLSDKGTYWLHAFEDLFSIEYISKLWGTSRQTPWPEAVVL